MEWYGQKEFVASPEVPFEVSGSEAGVLKSYGPLSFLKVTLFLSKQLTSDFFAKNDSFYFIISANLVAQCICQQVHNAGHMVPMDQPEASLEMLKRWTRGKLSEVTQEPQQLVAEI